jgi:hypothetical protein
VEYWCFQHSNTPLLHHSGSIDFHGVRMSESAVSRIGHPRISAGCQSATQQIANLRYEKSCLGTVQPPAPPGSARSPTPPSGRLRSSPSV